MSDEGIIPPPLGGDVHMALGVPAAIAQDPARTFANDGETAPESSHAAPDHSFVATIKQAGIPTDIVREVMDYFERGSTHDAATLDALDDYHRGQAVTELRDLWGDKYDDNIGAINAFLDKLPQGQAAAFRKGRTADGRALLNDSAQIQRLLGLTKTAGASIPRSEDPKTEIAAIEALMRKDRRAYNADGAIQARLRALYASQAAKH